MAAPRVAVTVEGSCVETGLGQSQTAAGGVKKPLFGTRFLTDPGQVFQHNAWDNVEWTDDQEAAAKKKVLENSQPLPPEKQEEYDTRANEYWNDFYTIHENRFFKDRHWLFTEFQELAPHCRLNRESPPKVLDRNVNQQLGLDQEGFGNAGAVLHADGDLPGSSATYRILEVGCGVGNTVFPVLKTNNFAVDLVKSNPEYDSRRCYAFVHDLSDADSNYPIPDGTLDVIVLIFVLSALHPNKMQASISRLAQLLKPGGVILLRDYGRYDMAQLRFKKGRCLSENFYVRGDGTRVYFFTQDELHEMFVSAGLEKMQNLVDRRLQVNRGKQLTMYRVWIQCKYRKPLVHASEMRS
ncbi:tRNA N(3)-methylcytidine methyltransferase METTL2 isoform X2 [Thalassophryne amazonica]|uniref:tRNA N(3)-methylcytidine methyltransferase METTL2 isoform X2 n=1 Tax=Thalassophryne amazonica TaxID=390379 RepID=UPI001471BFC3|nr:tRNA N(3)-methylcytidine methyltransferase METTL2 isoform X2 [Thalassophryne amazonica]